MALMAFNNSIWLSPGNGKAYHHRGLVYQKLRNNAQAKVDFNRAMQLGDTLLFDTSCCTPKKYLLIPCADGEGFYSIP